MERAVCPGCHFRCTLEEYQCGRGERLRAQWSDTGKLPERKNPLRNMHEAPIDDRILHSLRVMGMVLRDLGEGDSSTTPDRLVADCLMRHEGAASLKVIEQRTGIADVDDLIERGFVEPRAEGPGLLQFTSGGLEQARAWEAERKAAEAELLAVLSDEEKDQLSALTQKLLEPVFARRRNGGRPPQGGQASR